MSHNHEWQSRIKAVEREYFAMRQAAEHFRQAAFDDPGILQGNLEHREIAAALKNLEDTYIIRLFAEFESGARQYWDANWATEPKTMDLLDGLSARCKVPDTPQEDAHLVREYRNSLIHERDNRPKQMSIELVRKHLCHFFSFLPPRW
jgi:hypothetical protein